MAENFVMDKLKSPSTAKFSSIRETVTQYHGDCTHSVRGYVDAQNAFGATIRAQYFVRLKNDYGTDNWRALEFDMM